MGGLTYCDDLCVNTATSPLHCGECGRVCETPQFCADGECV
jgi:hypothetical protein